MSLKIIIFNKKMSYDMIILYTRNFNKKMSYDMTILYIILYLMFLLITIIIIYNLKLYTKSTQEEEFLPPYEQPPPSYELGYREQIISNMD